MYIVKNESTLFHDNFSKHLPNIFTCVCKNPKLFQKLYLSKSLCIFLLFPNNKFNFFRKY